MDKILMIDHEKCNGCTYCMLVCSMVHEGYVQREKSRVKVYKREERALGIPMLCEHCDNPPCIPVCSVNAIKKNPQTGIVSIDNNICTGCKLCIEKCPYSAIHIDIDTEKAFICDLCGGYPECAKVCLAKAITWVDALHTTNWRKKFYAEKRVKAMENLLEV